MLCCVLYHYYYCCYISFCFLYDNRFGDSKFIYYFISWVCSSTYDCDGVALHSESDGTLCYVHVNIIVVIVTSWSLNCQRSTASRVAIGFTIILCIAMIFILIVSLVSYENILYCAGNIRSSHKQNI